MELRQLGSSDIQVSVVGLGCNNFGWKADLEGTRAIIDGAIDAGITLFDTATSYGTSEDLIGELLGERRKRIVLATKFGSPQDPLDGDKRASRDYIVRAVENSLRRLKTDWIDLYQLHYPSADTPIDETLHALQDLISQGKVRAIGCSNFSASQLDHALAVAARRELPSFVSIQNEYNVLVRDLESELSPAIVRHGVGLLPYFPLANGVLTGKYKRGQPIPADARLADAPSHFDPYRDPAKWDIAEKLEIFAREHGHSLLELAFSWLAMQPGVSSVIAGVSRAGQLEANASAANWKMTPEELAEIDRITGIAAEVA